MKVVGEWLGREVDNETMLNYTFLIEIGITYVVLALHFTRYIGVWKYTDGSVSLTIQRLMAVSNWFNCINVWKSKQWAPK